VEDKEQKLAGAAFDLPTQDAEKLISSPAVAAAAKKLGFVLDRCVSAPCLPVLALVGKGHQQLKMQRAHT
jgi:hypothetical protein